MSSEQSDLFFASALVLMWGLALLLLVPHSPRRWAGRLTIAGAFVTITALARPLHYFITN